MRLLHIYPGQQNDDLEGDLMHLPLHATGSFEALSYTWGTRSIEQSIYVAGKRISITPNCAGAIRSLRHRNRVRVLWIDAICINQNDSHERAEQVGMMVEIYARAERTVVYLGAGDNTVHVLRNKAQINPGSGIGSQLGQHDQIEDAKARLLARDWFHRRWIIQEVLLSRDIIVQVGSHEFTWAELEILDTGKEIEVTQLAKKYLHPCSLSTTQAPNGQDWDPKAKAAWEEMFEQGEVVSMAKQRESTANLQRANKYRSPHTGFLMPPQLFDVLCNTSDFGCKEHRDRVFSIMSLFATKSDILLDHTCNEQDIYDSLTRELIALGDTRFLWLEDRTTWRPRWQTALSTLSTFVREKGRAAAQNSSATDIGRLQKELQLERRIGIHSCPSKIIWTAQGIRLGRISNISTQPFEHRHIIPGDLSTGDPHHQCWTSILKSLALKPFPH